MTGKIHKHPVVIAAFPGSYHASLNALHESDLEGVTFLTLTDKDIVAVEVQKVLDKGHHCVLHNWGTNLTELEEAGIPYALVYPDRSRKWELTVKATELMAPSDIEQGHSHWFVTNVGPMWERFLDKCEANTFAEARYCMGPDLMLDDMLRVGFFNAGFIKSDQVLFTTTESTMLLEKAPVDEGKVTFNPGS